MRAQSNVTKKQTELAEPISGVKTPASRHKLAKGRLSPRESDIARLVALGLSDKQIANKLRLTEGTVGWHLHEIFKKWQIHSRVALATRIVGDAVGTLSPSRHPSERQACDASTNSE